MTDKTFTYMKRPVEPNPEFTGTVTVLPGGFGIYFPHCDTQLFVSGSTIFDSSKYRKFNVVCIDTTHNKEPRIGKFTYVYYIQRSNKWKIDIITDVVDWLCTDLDVDKTTENLIADTVAEHLDFEW